MSHVPPDVKAAAELETGKGVRGVGSEGGRVVRFTSLYLAQAILLTQYIFTTGRSDFGPEGVSPSAQPSSVQHDARWPKAER